MAAISEHRIKVDPIEVQKFFNLVQVDKGLGTHVSAIVGFLGEDLVLGLFISWLKNEGHKSINILSYSCTPGGNKGQRLDAWISSVIGRRKILFQVEVKNWTANAIGGIEAPLEAKDCDLLKDASTTLNRYLKNKKVRRSTLKVLNNMEPPEGVEARTRVVPVLAVWSPVCTERAKRLTPYFSIPNAFRNKSRFPDLHIFSATNYLRTLPKKKLMVSMPRVQERILLLKRMLPGV
jgi:hypothetical protein